MITITKRDRVVFLGGLGIGGNLAVAAMATVPLAKGVALVGLLLAAAATLAGLNRMETA